MHANQRSRDWLAFFIALPVYALVWHFSSIERAAACLGTILLIYILVTTFWSCRRSTVFWVIILLFVVIHTFLIFDFKYALPSGPAISYVVPLFLADAFIMYSILKWSASKGMFK